VTFWRHVGRSLLHHRLMNLAVAIGIALTTAVIVGALLVGDSVRGSLVDLTLERLGKIDLLLVNDRFFAADLVEQAKSVESDGVKVAAAEGLCLIANVTVEGRTAGRVRGVLLVGRTADALNADLLPDLEWGPEQIVINRALADDLGAKVGDELIIRLPVANDVPAESPLGRKDGRVRSRAGLAVAAILPMRGWGQFQLRPSQQQPRTAFVHDTVLQQALGVGAKINAITVRSASDDRTTDTRLANGLAQELKFRAEDAGFQVELVTGSFGDPPQTAWSYAQVTTDRMIFSDAAVAAAQAALLEMDGASEPQPVFTYLANSLAKVGQDDEAQIIPYSTVAAVDSHPALGPFFDADGAALTLAAGEIALNAWAADDLQAAIGDRIEIKYFAAETTHGEAVEEAAQFTLAAILPLRQPTTPFRRRRAAQFSEAPYWANDPNLTPTVAGVTDQDSIDDWDPPFPFDSTRVRDQDDEYWEFHRTTPKAFVTLADGQKLWGSRFGQLTALRMAVPASEADVAAASIRTALAQQVQSEPSQFGYDFRAVKLAGLEASRGTTPFEWLFLGFSMFLLFSALALTAILFRLAMVLRQKEMGTLLAIGWSADRAGRALLAEVSIVALAGGILGVLGGIVYAAAMLAGLRTWWLAAVVTPFMHLHITFWAVVFGFIAARVVSMLVVVRTLQKLKRRPALQLLRGTADEPAVAGKATRVWPIAAGLIAAIGLAVLGTSLAGEAQAGCFFGGGAALLTALMLIVRRRLRSKRATPGRRSLVELAQSSVKRNPTRSLLTMSLMASATFLIIAISAFRLGPTEAGTGGFDWIGESDRSIFVDLNDGQRRQEEFGELAVDLAGAAILPLRVQAGDDASCRNLYQSAQPRLLGVTEEFASYFDESIGSFAWAKSGGAANPWSLLRGDASAAAGASIPVILDKNTAMFSLHLAGRVGEEFTIPYEQPLTFRIVGLLSNTILQGSLLISDEQLLRAFPETEGYRMLLVSAVPGSEAKVAQVLEERFNDEGLALRDAEQDLAELMAVQNTYLSTFQSLGVLGLLLGALGLAIVQVRNTIERRSELAAMRAIGFSRGRLGQMIATETVILLVAGLVVGTVAALATVMPHMIFGEANVPLLSVAAMLGIVFMIGLISSWLATRLVARLPLIDALRRDG
jgi:ABC-type antimicrobial peptide transport system permease subunit